MSDVVVDKVVVVAIKSAWYSKINWIQLGALILNAVITVVSGPALGLSPETQVKMLAALQAFQSLATIVIKVWFTSSVTPQSMVSPKTAE